MSNTPLTTQNAPDHKPRPMIDLLVSIVIPSVILMKFSGNEDLGATTALLVALAFPLGWGLFELLKYRKFNFIALLGLISVLLTGGIGLLKLDPQWLAIKEAAIPGLIGVAVLVSTRTRYPLIRALLYNPAIMDVAKIRRKLEERGNTDVFENRLLNATYLLSGTFLFSSVMNYTLAKWIVTSPAGSAAFNEELGKMTLLSYPVIAIPSTLMMMFIFYYLWRTIHGMTGFTLNEILVHGTADKQGQASR
ncbi:MAG: MFS transporter [Gammaproteobacteria bacterium]|nr:MAG: MFS transporter [Gammaproteobacteria bacterium]